MGDHVHGASCSHEACDHSLDEPDRGSQFSLFEHIDLSRVRGFNESTPDAAQNVFKPWDDRHNGKAVESDADEELIVYVPFTGQVKLKSVAVLGGPGGRAPALLKVHVNREDVDFSTVEGMEPAQVWELVKESPDGEPIEYPTKITKFTAVRSLSFHFAANYGDETTRVAYIGLKGEFTELSAAPAVLIYESAANPADHKVKGDPFGVSRPI